MSGKSKRRGSTWRSVDGAKDWVSSIGRGGLELFRGAPATDEEVLWRLRGYLDCLRGLSLDGLPDPKFIMLLCEKTGEPLVSLSYLEDLRRKLGAQTAGQ